MNQEIYGNASYIINKRTSLSIIIWSILMILLILSSVLICLFYNYTDVTRITGYFNEKLYIYIKEEDVGNLNDYKIKFNDNYLSFQIVEIKERVAMENEIFYEIILETNLEEKYKVTNNVFNLILEKNKTTLLKKMKGAL